MIKRLDIGHSHALAEAGLRSAELPPPHLTLAAAGGPAEGGETTIPSRTPSRARTSATDGRLRGLVAAHFDFIWRSLRRLGVPSTDVDDCTQQVFWVAARKLSLIHEGSERAFLFSTALRVASDARRSRMRRRGVPLSPGTGSP